MSKNFVYAPGADLIKAAQALTLSLYGNIEHLARITIRLKSGDRIRVDVPDEESGGQPYASPLPPNGLVPTPFQQGILQALNGQALRTDGLAHKVGNRRKLFIHPGGLRELQDHGMIAHHKRLGYYRPDALPPVLRDADRPNAKEE